MIVSVLVLCYLIFHVPLVQIKGKTSFKLPTNCVIHRTSHQSSHLKCACVAGQLDKKISNFDLDALTAELWYVKHVAVCLGYPVTVQYMSSSMLISK